MRIILSESKDAAVETVAELVLERLRSQPASTIGLATGKTMEPVYEALTRLARALGLSRDQAFFFMLDEYLDLPEDHTASFKAYVRRHVLDPLGIGESQVAFPPAQLRPVSEAGMKYEASIKEAGGIDLQLLGIGRNGHVGFNEPGSAVNSRTRVVELTPETRLANQVDFPDGEVPARALSMGIATIMQSRSLLMLATGTSKADAIKYLVNHHDDPSCPATFLKSHPHFVLVLDPEAASKINLKI